MILRPARAADSAAFEVFDLGDTSERVPRRGRRDRRRPVGLGQRPDRIRARTASSSSQRREANSSASSPTIYSSVKAAARSTVIATSWSRQSNAGTNAYGYATAIIETVLDAFRNEGVRTVDWLVHPRNLTSIAFSSRTFPTADETNPPEEQPYVRFLLHL